MMKKISSRKFLRAALCASLLFLIVSFSFGVARAAAWNGIEPFKTRRAEVVKILGEPISEQGGANSVMTFKVQGGTVTIAFVTAKFVAAKKLPASLEGTVQQIILQHDNASDTPETLKLVSNASFERSEQGGVAVFSNPKEGVFYTFVGGKLKTTRYTATSAQLVGSSVQTLHLRAPKIGKKS